MFPFNRPMSQARYFRDHGPALSAGLTLAASYYILVASKDASLGLPAINAALIGGGRHAMRLYECPKTNVNKTKDAAEATRTLLE